MGRKSAFLKSNLQIEKYQNKPRYKVCFGRKKMEARREKILRKTKVVSRPPLTLVLVDMQTYFTGQNMSF